MWMSSEEPSKEPGPETPAPETDEGTPAAAPEVEEPVSTPEEEPSAEEEYEELIEPEKPPKPRKKRGHLGAIITVVVILIILVVWTILSPRILPSEGKTYVEESSDYATLANFTGSHTSWAANTTWGISVSGPRAANASEPFSLSVLVTKVSEKPSNFWFRGTSISVTNMSVLRNGTPLASLTNKTDLGFGLLGTLNLSIADPGVYSLQVTVQFMVYVDMRIGFLPVEKINLAPLDLKTIIINP